MSRFDRHVRGDAVKWFVAFFLIFVLLAGVAIGGLELFGSGKAKPSNWFSKAGAPGAEGTVGDPSEDKPITRGDESRVFDGDGNELATDRVNEMPARMVFVAPTLERVVAASSPLATVTIHATVTPDDASYLGVNVDLAFADPGSAWASGKNVRDYVHAMALSPSGGTSDIQVDYKAPFGEQILLTVETVGENTEGEHIKKTCTVDCSQVVESADVYINGVKLSSREEGINKVNFYVLKQNPETLNGTLTVQERKSAVYTIPYAGETTAYWKWDKEVYAQCRGNFLETIQDVKSNLIEGDIYFNDDNTNWIGRDVNFCVWLLYSLGFGYRGYCDEGVDGIVGTDVLDCILPDFWDIQTSESYSRSDADLAKIWKPIADEYPLQGEPGYFLTIEVCCNWSGKSAVVGKADIGINRVFAELPVGDLTIDDSGIIF